VGNRKPEKKGLRRVGEPKIFEREKEIREAHGLLIARMIFRSKERRKKEEQLAGC